MEEWDLLQIHHNFHFEGTNSHNLIIESTDTDEVIFIHTHLRQISKYFENRIEQVSRDKHVAKIRLFDVATDNITEHMDSKKDRPYERDVYWQLLILIRSRGWKPFGKESLFIRHKT
jgi:hypothetical protein